jgi:hypothetical protein
MPRVTPELLDQTYAQVATNCEIQRGLLEPSKAPLATAVNLLGASNTLYWYNREANSGNGFWFEFSGVVDVMRGQIANDPHGRVYIFNNGVPKYTTAGIATSGGAPYPSNVFNLGLPAPSAPVATGPGGTVPSGKTTISTAYVVTYVSTFGEEGPPSFASNIVNRWDGGTVTLTGISSASGSISVALKRIYRAELNGVFQYVGSIGAASTIFTDTIDSDFLGEPIPSSDWVAPNTSIVGALSLPNGIVMAWWGNTLAFCEPYQPHAWPIRYQLALDYDIVGAAVTQNGVVVCTKGKPYLIAGSTPAGMSQNSIDVSAACAAKRSIVDMGEFTIYAGTDGLIAIGGMNAEIITKDYITPEQWRTTYNPSSIIGVRYKDYYLGFYSGGSFLFKPGLGFLNFTDTARAAFYDDFTGDVYFLAPTNNIKIWGKGTNQSLTWKSKRIRVPNMGNFACAKVDANAYPVTFKYYADQTLVKTISVTSKQSFRLPTASRYRTAEFELTGTNAILSAQLASSKSEIA